MRRLYLLVAVVLVVLFFMAQTVPPGGVVTTGLAKTSDLIVTSPLVQWVLDGGVDSNPCTLAQPCATLQAAANLVANNIADHVVTNVGPGVSGPGFRKEGYYFTCHPAGDGGVVCGSWDVLGTPTIYTQSDGGPATGTIASVATGTETTCTRDVWGLSGVFDAGELVDHWISAGTDSRKWRINANDAGTVQLSSMGTATAPTIGASYTIWGPPSSRLSQNLGQLITNAGPNKPGIGQITGGAAFILSPIDATTSNGAGTDTRMRISNFYVTGSTTGIRANGMVNWSENMCSTTGSCYRILDGVSAPALERNIITAGGNWFIGRYLTTHALIRSLQMYNNGGAGTGVGIYTEAGESIWTAENDFPGRDIRFGSCRNCLTVCDGHSNVRTPAGINDTPGGNAGGWEFDGTTFANLQNVTYPINAGGQARIKIDQNQGVFTSTKSTISCVSPGHCGAISDGKIDWANGTTWTGGGFIDICQTKTGFCQSISNIHNRKWAGAIYLDGSGLYESGNAIPGIWEPPLALGAPLDFQLWSGTCGGGGSVSVTLGTTFANNTTGCTCNDQSGVAGVPTSCNWDGVGSTTAANFNCIAGHVLNGECFAPK